MREVVCVLHLLKSWRFLLVNNVLRPLLLGLKNNPNVSRYDGIPIRRRADAPTRPRARRTNPAEVR